MRGKEQSDGGRIGDIRLEPLAEVARLVSYGVTFSPLVMQALTEKFGCSPSAIRADLKLIAQRRKALSPYATERQSSSTYARSA